jgi:hypothetical protein
MSRMLGMGDHSRPCLHQTKSVPHSKHWTATVCIPRAVPPYCRRRFVELARGAPTSLDHLGAREQCRRNFEAERPRGGQIYDQINLVGCSTGMSAGFAPQRPDPAWRTAKSRRSVTPVTSLSRAMVNLAGKGS